jgi:hypothetical protein
MALGLTKMIRSLVLMGLLAMSAVWAGEPGSLQLYEVGKWSELRSRSNPSGLGLIPVPALSAILFAKEKEKGSPLTEAEVVAIRDDSAVIALPDHGKALAERRGYEDIDPDNCWREWQTLRGQIRE